MKLPFEIYCPTCGCEIQIEDPALVGELISCPHCAGMVMVSSPEEESPSPSFSAEGEVPEQIAIAPCHSLPEEISDFIPSPKREIPENISPPKRSETKNDPFPTAPPVPSSVPPENRTDDEEELDEEFEEETPLYLTPLFLFGIGSVIALLLAIILVLVLKKAPQPEETSSPPPAAEQLAQAPTTPEESLPTETLPSDSEGSDRIAPFEEEVPNDLLSNENFDSQGSGLSDENYGENAQEADESEAVNDPQENGDLTGEEDLLDTPENGEISQESPLQETENSPNDSEPSSSEEVPMETISEETTIAVAPELDQNLSVKIDIPQRLAIAIPSIRLPSQTLPELITILQGITGVPISIDWNSIESAPALCSNAIPVSFDQTTTGTLLNEVARAFQLTVTTEEEQILLSRPQSPIQIKQIDISDITSPSAPPVANEGQFPFSHRILPAQITEEVLLAFLMDLLRVTAVNDPNSLENLPTERGTPSLTIENGILIAEGDSTFLARTERLLAQLRQVRQLEQPNLIPPEELIPETIGYEKLEEPISLNFMKPVTLNESIPLLARKENVHYLLDLAAITRAGISLDTRIQFHSDTLPAEQILTELTAGYRLSWFMPTSDLIVITTKEELLRYPSIEILFYAAPKDGEIQKEFDDDTVFFIEKGMSLLEATGGTLWIDPISGCLFVRADAATRRAVRWKENKPTENTISE